MIVMVYETISYRKKNVLYIHTSFISTTILIFRLTHAKLYIMYNNDPYVHITTLALLLSNLFNGVNKKLTML